MSRALRIVSAPAASVQDAGRPGYLALGLSKGGAADPLALAEGAALLGQDPGLAAIEVQGFGARFAATCDLRIALTGAEGVASVDGSALAWNASHALPAGCELTLGPARAGVYGYLHVGGGIDTAPVLGARSAHLAAGLGGLLAEGDELPVGPDAGQVTGLRVTPIARFGAGTLRVVPSLQTASFPPELLERFQSTEFAKDARANRMGVRMAFDGPGFEAPGGRTVLSEVIVPGDIQITGDGTPYVLLAESQTTGGYPRIGTVIPCDLPRAAQARPGETLRFRFVDEPEALAAEAAARREIAGLKRSVGPLVRDPGDIADLLSYQLVSGAVAGLEDEGETT